MTNTINPTTLHIIYDNMSAEARAEILFTLDTELRNGISNEEIFERWLMCGVPDGCMTAEHVQETMDTESMTWEGFEEYILLAASCFEMDNEEDKELE